MRSTLMDLTAEARLARRRARAEKQWHAAILVLGGPPVVTIASWLLLPQAAFGSGMDVTAIWSIFLGALVIAGVVSLALVFYTPAPVFWLAYVLLSAGLALSVQDFRARSVGDPALVDDTGSADDSRHPRGRG
jgi:hypothetical protein